MAMQFHETERLTREEALERLAGPDETMQCRAVISLASDDPDPEFVQELCLKLLAEAEVGYALRATAVLGFSHVARIHGRIDLDTVLPVLYTLQDDPELGWRVSDVLDDLRMVPGFHASWRRVAKDASGA
jgi:hypothetical protein